MTRVTAEGLQTPRSRSATAADGPLVVGMPVYDDRTYMDAWGKELTVPRSLDRPDQPSVPDQSDAIETPSRLRPASSQQDLPATLDRGDQSELADSGRWSKAALRQRLEHLPPGHPSSLRSDDPESGEARGFMEPESARISSGGADAIKQNYWSEVPRFLRAWADHVRRWPERLAAVVDRTQGLAGSWRGDGNQYLNPDQHAQASDVIADVGRGEKKLTAHLGEAERENAYGGWLEGIKHCLKGEERIKEKVANELGITPAMTPRDAINKLNDAIRYTFCFEPANYSGGYLDVKERLETREYRMVYSKNHWRDDPEYKGINTRWVTPEGQRFEVQFHTAESYHAKQEVTHGSYERLRNPLTEDGERVELEAFQREVSSWISAPDGALEIPDYGTRGR